MKIIECPRDAMQGINRFIPTEEKIRYINQLLKVGFDTIDFGSFVSSKAIPQMKDTAEVLRGLHLTDDSSRLLAIIANLRGAERAIDFDEISSLGYPLSLSPTFQKRNTNRTIDEAFDDLAEIQELCQLEDRTLVVYLSMGFGNPYGEPYDSNEVIRFVQRLNAMEVDVISLSDTIGTSTPSKIEELFTNLIPKFPHIEFGAHLHSTKITSSEKIRAALKAGCRRIDGALLGYGGCPMAADELVGNVPTENICAEVEQMNMPVSWKMDALEESIKMANRVFQLA